MDEPTLEQRVQSLQLRFDLVDRSIQEFRDRLAGHEAANAEFREHFAKQDAAIAEFEKQVQDYVKD